MGGGRLSSITIELGKTETIDLEELWDASDDSNWVLLLVSTDETRKREPITWPDGPPAMGLTKVGYAKSKMPPKGKKFEITRAFVEFTLDGKFRAERLFPDDGGPWPVLFPKDELHFKITVRVIP